MIVPDRSKLLHPEVLVDALEGERPLVLYADVVQHHELGQPYAVDQHDAVGDATDVLARLLAEPARREEDAPVGLHAMQCADERMEVGPPDGMIGRIPLSLDVDPVEPQRVLPDDPIDAAVARSSDVLDRAGTPAVAHRAEQRQDRTFEECGLVVEDALKQLGREVLFVLAYGRLDGFDRRAGEGVFRGTVFVRFPNGPTAVAEVAVLLELFK